MTDPEPSRGRIHWQRLLLETFAIVFGILLAFSIDAAWDERQDRAEEQEILRGLRDEFGRHAERLGVIADQQARIVLHTGRLMTFLASRDLRWSGASLDSAAFWTAFAGTWDPANSSLNAVLGSGRLELITSGELRTELAGWQAVVDEVRDNQVTMRTYAVQVIWPALARRGILMRGWNYNGRYPDWPSHSESASQYERLRGDAELIDLVSTKYTWWQGTGGELETARQAVDRITRLIELQLR